MASRGPIRSSKDYRFGSTDLGDHCTRSYSPARGIAVELRVQGSSAGSGVLPHEATVVCFQRVKEAIPISDIDALLVDNGGSTESRSTRRLKIPDNCQSRDLGWVRQPGVMELVRSAKHIVPEC